jgi:hypothetical protein
MSHSKAKQLILPKPYWTCLPKEVLQYARCFMTVLHPTNAFLLFSPAGHSRGGNLHPSQLLASTFLHPFAPRALPRFHATMGALTPARGALRALYKRNEHPPRPGHRSPWLTRHELPCIPSPTTSRARSSLSCCPPSVIGFRTLVSDRLTLCSVGVSLTSRRPRALARVPVWTSPLMRRLVATYGRNVFALLRTASSPPVAPHPASRRRSYLQLSGVGISRERTCTSQIAPAPRRTHSGGNRNPVGRTIPGFPPTRE